MRCPFCKSENTKVVDSRDYIEGNATKRRRECLSCKKRFTTYEKIEEREVYIIKKDNTREKFNKEKLLRGLSIASIKRNITRDTLEGIVDDIERRLQNSLESEVHSKKIGEMIMDILKDIDEVAYVRFASVYEEFDDIKSFIEIVEKIKKDKNDENTCD